jgi:AcrR family transcriptional regulator
MAERLSRAEQQARTRRRLLDEGRRIFAERGFTAATVEEITAAAGVTRGALYKHFDGKEGLFLSFASEVAEQQLEEWSAGEDAARTDEQHLAALARPLETVDVDLGLASVEFLAHVRSRPQFHTQALRMQLDADVGSADMLRRTCEGLGVEPAIPVEDLVPIVAGLANGLLLRRLLDPDLDVPRLFRAGLVALLTGTSPPVPHSKELTDDRR